MKTEQQELEDRKKEAVRTLDVATTLVYNIPGHKWQVAYDILEALIKKLKTEIGESND
jgi:hypothetical protein